MSDHSAHLYRRLLRIVRLALDARDYAREHDLDNRLPGPATGEPLVTALSAFAELAAGQAAQICSEAGRLSARTVEQLGWEQDQARDVDERERIAEMLEDDIPGGESGNLLGALVRGCYHWRLE